MLAVVLIYDLSAVPEPISGGHQIAPSFLNEITGRRARTSHANIHVRGYTEEGTITTPFDVTALNDPDRFHLIHGRH